MFLLEIYRNECCEEVSSTWWVLCYCQISEWRRYCDGWRQAIALCVCVCVCVCPSSHTYHISTAHCISLGGEGNALYPGLS